MSPLRHPADATDRRPDPPTVAAEPALSDLGAAEAETRRDAARRLPMSPEVMTEMVRCVGTERDGTVLEALCTRLAAHDVPEVVDGLIGHLAGDDARRRNAVIEVLARTPIHTARRMPQLLGDPDPDVRILTVMLLSALRLPQVHDWLMTLVAEDDHPNVVASAIGELAGLVGPRDRDTLLAARDRFASDPFIAFSVTRVLGDHR